MEPVLAAKRMWETDTYSLTKVWEDMPSKLLHEEMVASWVGQVGSVADLGCGIGRYATALKGQFNSYIGFDITAPMVQIAQEVHSETEGAEFSLVDIFNFQATKHYDVALMIDVAQHMQSPTRAVQRMLQLWDADRYIFSILAGDVKEELLHSTVVPVSWVVGALREGGLWGVRLLNSNLVLVRDETFVSIFVEVTKC